MDAISQEFILDGSVSYWNVDRENLLSLRSLFAFLQEAAIRHADQCGAGAHAKETRGDSWVLHRMTVAVRRYPRYEDDLRVVTWSSGIRAFKGFRDFRCYCAGELVASGSSIWLYVNVATKTISRVPKDVAEHFPSKPEEVFAPELERWRMAPPSPDASGSEISVRYSDFDGNNHVNNTAYFDYLQTGLARSGLPPRPGRITVQFMKEILPSVERVKIILEPRPGETAFSLGDAEGLFAQGSVA